MKIKFENVGRGKMTWEQDIKELSHRELYNAVKKKGALMSRGIDFDLGDDNTGIIFAGMHSVGRFSVIERSTLPENKPSNEKAVTNP